MTIGRPTEYSEEYIAKVDEYLAQQVDEEYKRTKTESSASSSYEHRIRVKLPTVEGFARFLGVSKKSLYNWKDTHPDFLHALEKIEIEQKERLICYGLSGDYNSTIAKLILSANHGMNDKVPEISNKSLTINFDSAFNK